MSERTDEWTNEETSQDTLLFSKGLKLPLLLNLQYNPRISSYLNGGVLLASIISLALPSLRFLSVERYPSVYLPLFITSANLALILSMAFF